MTKYKTLKELQEAIQSGEVDMSKCYPLCIDNDSTHIYTKTIDEDGDEDIGICLFSLHPADLMGEALDLLGIPWEEA